MVMDKGIRNRLSSLGVVDPILEDNRKGKILDVVDNENNQFSMVMKNIGIINKDNIVIGYINEFKVVEISGGCMWETIAVADNEKFNTDTNINELKGNGLWLGNIYSYESREDLLGKNVSVFIIRRYFSNPKKDNVTNLRIAAGEDISKNRVVYVSDDINNDTNGIVYIRKKLRT